MKTLIFNGSPRKNGETAYMIRTLQENLGGDFKVVNAYRADIRPCIDCRWCFDHAGSDMYKRRAGWKYAKTQARLFKFMKEQDFIGEWQYIKSCVIRSGSALAPNWLRKFMFEKVLRK